MVRHGVGNAAVIGNTVFRFESERFRQIDPFGLCESKHTTRTLYNKCLRRKVAAGRKQVAANPSVRVRIPEHKGYDKLLNQMVYNLCDV